MVKSLSYLGKFTISTLSLYNIALPLLLNSDYEINYSKKIFGKETDNLVTSIDIFSDTDFKSHKKFIPAYFDKGDVKVPYEASRLQFLQKLDLLSVFKKRSRFKRKCRY